MFPYKKIRFYMNIRLTTRQRSDDQAPDHIRQHETDGSEEAA
jgi:hypothetical protein